MGRASLGIPRLREEKETEAEPTGPHAPGKGACVGVQAGSDGLQQWAEALMPTPYTGHWGQGLLQPEVELGDLLTRCLTSVRIFTLSTSLVSFLFLRYSVA